VRVAAFAVGGCIDNVDSVARLLEDLELDVVLAAGDFVCPDSVSLLERISNRLDVTIYAVTGRRDDTHIARLLEDTAEILDGRFIYVGKGVYLAGVGGREPLMNIERLRGEINHVADGRILLASYYPLHGVFDSSALGPARGLFELADLAAHVNVVLAAQCSPRGATLSYNEPRHVCLYAVATSRCVHIFSEEEATVRCL